MHIVVIGWLFVTVLMAVAEAAAPNGSVLGAFFTLLLYGLLPLGIVMYILGTPGRRRLRREREEREAQETQEAPEAPADESTAAPSSQRDRSGEPAADPIASKREEA